MDNMPQPRAGALQPVVSTHSSPLPRIAPIAGGQRVELIDSLRGFALVGVLLENLRSFSLFAYLPRDERLLLWSADIDRFLAPAAATMVSGKFITLFSLLFGVSFAMQLQRIGDSSALRRCYVRRLGILLVIGLLHALVWRGDILRYYALLGLILLPLARMPAKVLAWSGALVTVAAYPTLRLVLGDPRLDLATRSEAYSEALVALQSSHWPTLLRGNLDFSIWYVLTYWNLVFYVAGVLLIGAAMGKSGVILRAAENQSFWKRLFAVTFLPGLALNFFLRLLDYQLLDFGPDLRAGQFGSACVSMLRHLSSLTLGLAYMAAFVVLFAHRRVGPHLQTLAPAGQMALTNYLLQTVIAVTLFYGVGLAIGPRFGMPAVVATTFAVFLAQLGFSRWWLRKFRFGPVEWAWRSIAYGHIQPINRTPVSPSGTSK